MKKYLLSSIIFCCCMFNLHAQRFQATTGTPFNDDNWAVIEDAPINRYVAIGNTYNSDGFATLWISSYTPAGVLLSSAVANNGKQMIARDISIAPVDSSFDNARTYYVTGWAGGNGSHLMFVGRININGVFLWYSESPILGTSNNAPEEGVAIVTAPNGDAVAVGHVYVPIQGNIPAGPRVMLQRFSPTGIVRWSNVYNQSGNWKVRELANGVPVPNCAPSPTTLPGEFIITGEVDVPSVTGASKPQTFAAVYNGAGTECWRNLYPTSNLSTSNFTGDAGYDVFYKLATKNYVIAGVAQMGAGRAVATSTPYFLEITPSGALVAAAVYTKPDNSPLGLYPRCVAKGRASADIVCAGPDFADNNTFYMRIVSVGVAGTIYRYPGIATANSVAQPFWLDDAQPESILYTALPGVTQGYVISTNAIPGVFGGSDAHLIKTDIFGKAPTNCPEVAIQHKSNTAGVVVQSSSTPSPLQWVSVQTSNTFLPVQQRFCRDTCIVTANFSTTQTLATVNFTGIGSGNGSLSYSWTFGDGGISTLQSPSHTYPGSGNYLACLTVTNVNGSGDSCKTTFCKDILVNLCSTKASFTDSVVCKYKVIFANTSTGAGTLTYNWFFDDGTSSNLPNPVKVFSSCGSHVVKLIACDSLRCCDTTTMTVIIPCCSVKSDFCLQDSGRYVKLIYNTAANPSTTTYFVYLDGVLTAWTNNTNKALVAGIHTICVKARNVLCPGDTCCSTCCKTISVSNPCTLLADFWYQLQSGGNVVFINKSLAGSGSEWDFGDGSPISTTFSPTHVYPASGTYLVCLNATVISGSDTCRSRVCRKIVIETACKTLANFMTKYCIGAPLTVGFTNLSTGGGSYLWDFGDGTTSALTSPSHTYNVVGSYTVCLTQTINANCLSKTCYRVIVSSSSCDINCNQLPPPPSYTSKSGEAKNLMVLEGSISSEDGTIKDNAAELNKQKLSAELTNNDKLSLFPNPASQKVQVLFESNGQKTGEVTVISTLGSVVYKKVVAFQEGKNQLTIPIQALANGNYFLKVNSGDYIRSSMFSVKK